MEIFVFFCWKHAASFSDSPLFPARRSKHRRPVQRRISQASFQSTAETRMVLVIFDIQGNFEKKKKKT